MATDESGLRDEVSAELNPTSQIPDRPADDADDETGDYVTAPGLTRDELIELADRLGG